MKEIKIAKFRWPWSKKTNQEKTEDKAPANPATPTIPATPSSSTGTPIPEAHKVIKGFQITPEEWHELIVYIRTLQTAPAVRIIRHVLKRSGFSDSADRIKRVYAKILSVINDADTTPPNSDIPKAKRDVSKILDPKRLDPTPDKRYVDWLKRQISSGKMNGINTLDVFVALRDFYAKTTKGSWRINIDFFKSPEELLEVMRAIKPDGEYGKGNVKPYPYKPYKPPPNSTPQRGENPKRTNREGTPSQQEIVNYLKDIYPEEHGLTGISKDRWGLYSDNPTDGVSKILACTTPSQAVKQEFEDGGYDLLLSHHDFTVGVPQIIFHLTMDFADRGHNGYFANRMGLQDVSRIGGLSVKGTLSRPLQFDQFTNLLKQKGFKIKGMVWRNPEFKDDDSLIKSVVFCSGMGGITLSKSWEKGPYSLTKTAADVFVTGELTQHPKETPTQFRYIVELGHTPSEKPVFHNIANMLKNRWRNLQVDMAGEEADKLGEDILVVNDRVQQSDQGKQDKDFISFDEWKKNNMPKSNITGS